MCDTLKCNTMHTKLLPESITEVQERGRRWIEALPNAVAEPQSSRGLLAAPSFAVMESITV